MSKSGTYAVILLLFAVLVTGCNKDKRRKWKLPTEVSTTMDITKGTTGNGKARYSGGHIIIRAYNISGVREQGADISFNRNFSAGLTIPFDANNNVADLQFDIPQGAYTKMDIDFETYSNQSTPSILILGTYRNNVGTDIPIRFEFLYTEDFEIIARDSGNSGKIVLDKDQPSSTQLILDPQHWFQIVTNNQWENATLTDVQGTQTILITEDKNEDIYDNILDRIDESSEAIFP